MSEFMTALIVSGSIFGVMMLTRFGRREYTWHKVLMPVISSLRIGVVWSVDNLPSFREQAGTLMISHQVVPDSIAPFFILMALTTVIVRVVAVKLRTKRLTDAAAPAQPRTYAS